MLAAACRLSTSEGEIPAAEARAGTSLACLTASGPGPARVVDVGYRAAPRELIRLETSRGRVLVLTPEHPVFCRFLPGAARWDVALVKEVGVGAVLVSGQRGLREIGERTYFYRTVPEGEGRTEEIFLLATLPDEGRATLTRKLLNTRFGVPEATGGYKDMERGAWRQLFLEVDTIRRARELLDDLDLDPREPHWVQRSLTATEARRHLLVEACFRHRGWSVEVRRPDRQRGRPPRAAPRAEVERLQDLASYEGLEHVDVDRRYDLGGGRLYRLLRAAAVRPGMGLPGLEGDRPGEELVVRADRVPGAGLVYRVEAPEALGLVAEGVVLGGDGSRKREATP